MLPEATARFQPRQDTLVAAPPKTGSFSIADFEFNEGCVRTLMLEQKLAHAPQGALMGPDRFGHNRAPRDGLFTHFRSDDTPMIKWAQRGEQLIVPERSE